MANAHYVSNEIEDFEQGGLYPGGTGVIEDIGYVLWDYDGKRAKDSVVAVFVQFQPTDGSNEGKPVPIHWTCGDPASFAPDPTGGHLIALKTREKQSDNSNWALALKRFRDNCGLEPGKLSTVGGDKPGIKALLRTEMTVARIDQPTREGLEKDEPKEGQEKGKGFKPTILVPTKAKFPWEKGAGKVTTMAKPVASSPATTTTTTATPAASNGASDGSSVDLSILIKDAVTTAGGLMEYPELHKDILGRLADVNRTDRVAYMKQVKDPAYITQLATENGWTFDGKNLSI